MRKFLFIALFSVTLAAQPDLTRITKELRTAIETDSLVSASELANRLDEAVREHQKMWLIRDSATRIQETLAWLPADIETFWVNENPLTIDAEASVQTLYGRPEQLYSIDRLWSLDDGKWSRILAHHTIRLVAAGARNIAKSDRNSVPAMMPEADVVYFYFLADTPELPPADETVSDHPVWHAIGKVDAGGPFRPAAQREPRDDENWIAEFRPGVLILSNRRALLSEILDRIAASAPRAALPPDLPEWRQVDGKASFWGLRHYSAQSKPVRRQGDPEGPALGVTARFNSTKQQVEVCHFSATVPPAQEPTVRLIVDDLKRRGPLPFHSAVAALGFGAYPAFRKVQ
jgi:hypothetical protein